MTVTKYAKQEEWSEMRWSPGEPILIRGDIYFRYHDEQLRIVEIKRVKGDTVTYRVWGSKADWGSTKEAWGRSYSDYQRIDRQIARQMWVRYRLKCWLVERVNSLIRVVN